MQIVVKNDIYLLNYCSKHLARGNHYIDFSTNNPNLTNIAEAWRFPIINSDSHPESTQYKHNEVTFIYKGYHEKSIKLVGNFDKLYEPIELKPIKFKDEPTHFYSVTIILPIAQKFRYFFLVDGQRMLDPINPQRVQLSNGKEWSCFFTDFSIEPNNFEEWELKILIRLTQHILPFQTTDAENFLRRYYNDLSENEKKSLKVYNMDAGVGEVNYIDNIISREEKHHLIDYKMCLEQIDRVLRQRNQYVEPWNVSKQLIVELYDEMALDNVIGWNKDVYNSPKYFLQLLRRHAICGAFSHPKYGGNIAGAGWSYLSERYIEKQTTLFAWREGLEKPLGVNVDYIG